MTHSRDRLKLAITTKLKSQYRTKAAIAKIMRQIDIAATDESAAEIGRQYGVEERDNG